MFKLIRKRLLLKALTSDALVTTPEKRASVIAGHFFGFFALTFWTILFSSDKVGANPVLIFAPWVFAPLIGFSLLKVYAKEPINDRPFRRAIQDATDELGKFNKLLSHDLLKDDPELKVLQNNLIEVILEVTTELKALDKRLPKVYTSFESDSVRAEAAPFIESLGCVAKAVKQVEELVTEQQRFEQAVKETAPRSQTFDIVDSSLKDLSARALSLSRAADSLKN